MAGSDVARTLVIRTTGEDVHKGTHGFLGLLRHNIYLQKATSMKWKDEIWPPSIPSFQGVFSLEPKCTRMTWPPTGRRTKELTT